MSLRTTRQLIEALGLGESNLRVTRQMVEALGTGTSQLRATRQMVEILIPDRVITRTWNDSLVFSELVGHMVDRNPKVYDTLSFVEYIPTIFNLVVTDTLTLVDDGRRSIIVSVSDTLDLVENNYALALFGLYWPTGDSLVFTEGAVIEGLSTLSDSLPFVEVVNWVGPRYTDPIQNYLTFSEMVWNSNTYRVSVSDLLTLTSQAGRVASVTISDSLSFSDDGFRNLLTIDLLAFNEVVLNGKGLLVDNSLSFTQVVTLQGGFIRLITDSLNIGQSATHFYLTSCIDKQYHPFVGESSIIGQPTPPNTEISLAQGLPIGAGFQLSYPLNGATDTVILRAPELDTRDKNAFNRVNRETRGGRLVVFADPTWPKVNTLSCTFIGLLKTEIDTLQDFILNYIGEEIQVIDWDGRIWEGVVLKPNDPATCDGKDRWSVGFEFEGTLKENYTPGLPLIFTDTASNIVLRCPQATSLLVFVQDAAYRLN